LGELTQPARTFDLQQIDLRLEWITGLNPPTELPQALFDLGERVDAGRFFAVAVEQSTIEVALGELELNVVLQRQKLSRRKFFVAALSLTLGQDVLADQPGGGFQFHDGVAQVRGGTGFEIRLFGREFPFLAQALAARQQRQRVLHHNDFAARMLGVRAQKIRQGLAGIVPCGVLLGEFRAARAGDKRLSPLQNEFALFDGSERRVR
jgi:hypothetical protein